MAEVKLVCRRCNGYGIIPGELGHGQRPCPDCRITDGASRSGAGPAVASDDTPGETLQPPGDDPGVSSADGPGSATDGAGPSVPGPSVRIEFRLTFTLRYAREPHPNGLWVNPDGWVTIIAPSYDEARQVAFDLFGSAWGDLYDADHLDPSDFPRGELLRVIVPECVLEVEDHRV